MANREYEMLFKLGARLNQNFTGTFNSAQRVLAATQKELQSLNRLQSDVNGYQRQQASIEKTNGRLELYQKQLEFVRHEMEKTGGGSDELKLREAELRLKIHDTETALADKNKRLTELSDSLSKAGVNVNALTEESQRLEREIGELRTQEEAAAREAQNFGNNSESAFEAAGSALVTAGIAAGLKEIYDAYKECISISMEFGGTMSTVEALSGANVKEMQELSAKAKELGASTAFTANQSAEAMTYMGMAGWNAGQMISGMDGMMALAAASGEDLGMVSDIVTDNLTAFGLQASDTAHFADVLAQTASKSNTSVSVMGETFKTSAAIAGALGYSIEDVAIQVGAMANAGVKGSIAGTALKNIFNGISGEITLTSQAFGEATYTGVNLDGSMKELSETVSDLRWYFDQMTDSEKKANAQAIAGERGYNGLLAILNTTDEQYAELSANINDCAGAAQRMANIKLDNLQGDVTLLQSAADGLKMSIGELYDDELRGLAQLGADVLSGINEFVEKNPTVVKAIIAVTAEVGLLIAGYTAYNAVKKIKNALTASEIALSSKKIAVMGGVVAAIAVATAAVVALREAYKTESLETQMLNTATKEQYDNVSQLNDEYERACKTYGETSDQARALKYDLDEANASIEAQQFSVKELYAEIDTLHQSTSDMLSSYRDSTKEIDEQHERTAILIAKLKELGSSSESAAESQTQMESIIAELNTMFPDLDLNIKNVNGSLDDMTSRIDKVWTAESRQAKHDIAQSQMNDLIVRKAELEAAYEKAEIAQREAQKRFLNAVGDHTDLNAGNVVQHNIEVLWSMINGTAETAQEDLDEANEAFSKIYRDLQEINSQISEISAESIEYQSIIDGTSDELISAYDGVSIAISDVKGRTEALLTAYNDAYTAAYESVSGQYSLWDKAAQVIPTSIDTINTALDTQYEYWNDYNTNLSSLLARAEGIEGLKDVLATFSDGSEDSINTIAGMADATDEELKQMVDNYQKLREEQDSVSASLANVRVDYESEMEQITANIQEAVERMNMDEQAADAAKETILAYADAISAYKGTAVEAAEAVSAAVTGALAKASSFEISYDAAAPAVSVPALGDILPTITGPQLRDLSGINAYANGTNNAARGWDLVGENGPELRYFNGGETVIPTSRTQAILRDYGKMVDYNEAINGEIAQAAIGPRAGHSETVNISISPSFVIQGNADGVEDAINGCVEKIKEMVLDALDERERNARRSAYV